jgi:uncharacterized protein YdeI (YjbR/CyaY-like superfamily)
MAKKDPRIDDYIASAPAYARPILKEIRKRVHAACPEVIEDLKWRHPAFMYKGILAGMAAHKQHVTFGFWDQMMGTDEKSKEAAGQFGRLTSVDDLPTEKKFSSLTKEAVARRDAGVKPVREKTAPKAPIPEPDYFTAALKKNKKASATWERFAPSHRREYLEWITDAKQDATRERRVATALDWLAEGKSRNWKYERR